MRPVAGATDRTDNRGMYIPAHFAAEDADVRDLLRSLGASNLITATAEGLLATMLPLVYDEPGSRLGSAAGACRPEQSAVEGPGYRRGARHRPGTERLHLAVVVRHQAGARPSRPDVELRHGARPRPARGP